MPGLELRFAETRTGKIRHANLGRVMLANDQRVKYFDGIEFHQNIKVLWQHRPLKTLPRFAGLTLAAISGPKQIMLARNGLCYCPKD